MSTGIEQMQRTLLAKLSRSRSVSKRRDWFPSGDTPRAARLQRALHQDLRGG